MKNFRSGQQVVFCTKQFRTPREIFEAVFHWYVLPQEMEIVTIYAMDAGRENHWCLVEYPLNKRNRAQSFTDRVLYPLEYINAQLTNQLLTDLFQKIHQIPTPAK